MHQAIAALSSERFLQKLRLGAGLVMLAFVAMHLVNHALLLVSLDTAERVSRLFALFWRSPAGTLLLYGALVIHVVLVLRSLYARRTLRMPAREAVQTAFGLLIPFLIIEHAVPARLSQPLYGIVIDYRVVVNSLWVVNPLQGFRQSVALLVIWTHGCIGVYFWLRFRPWFARVSPYLFAIAILVPVLALLGFAETGRMFAHMAETAPQMDPARAEAPDAARPPIDQAAVAEGIGRIKIALYIIFLGAIALVLGLRRMRTLAERASQITIRYSNGALVHARRGLSLLEASRQAGVPHYSVCGGKGRCSTCRVRILDSAAPLPPPGSIEAATLARVHADEHVRLGCQLHPEGDVSVALLMAPHPAARLPVATEPVRPGREEEIAVLFCDLRNFTDLSEARLPYDVVFLLNRYFAIVGQAVEQAGGRLDKFIGDGAMALFGLGADRDRAARQALAAAAAIVRDIARLNAELGDEFSVRLRIAVGVHAGPSVVGMMGYGATKSLTAIGDTVNVASRLETTAKEHDVAIAVSERALAQSGLDTHGLRHSEVAIRGRTAPLRVFLVTDDESRRFAMETDKA
ncbi:adenylate/guanylate cyclase domain-containing protein (plasmid) [Rhizobium sp. TRM96647]|uniref:adenylate/guanylate cyclase domain-containing protein n=1 Tax=unclassified Rhizobium TaxID=2613769 RepID=UPI0021E6DFD2|nr:MULTISPECIES: adenylate/guanylate cyclase domain-containing protein [unclassified Rhizobium]MCV3735716.1 adenylate/guanylate cyclase domain-containing protein [Rhizobium sp. TRM96647]MCV3757521.1 adenylate/guanylate cyclase domain-containing protein [Rhizobium sp. TRM96650]